MELNHVETRKRLCSSAGLHSGRLRDDLISLASACLAFVLEELSPWRSCAFPDLCVNPCFAGSSDSGFYPLPATLDPCLFPVFAGLFGVLCSHLAAVDDTRYSRTGPLAWQLRDSQPRVYTVGSALVDEMQIPIRPTSRREPACYRGADAAIAPFASGSGCNVISAAAVLFLSTAAAKCMNRCTKTCEKERPQTG